MPIDPQLIKQLTTAEKLELIDDLWDEIESTSENPPVPPALIEELLRRSDYGRSHPESMIPFEKVREEFEHRYG